NPQQVNVLRGRQGTMGRAWTTGTTWTCAPTVRDVLPVVPDQAALPTDMHVGGRVVQRTIGSRERTKLGWAPSAGAAHGSEAGPLIFGATTYPPDDAVIVARGASVSGTTDSNGNYTLAYRAPFLGNTLSVSIVSTSYTSMGAFVVYAATVNGFSFTVHENASTTRRMNGSFSAAYTALGW
ncbi:MAG: hypothetical protein M3443_13290, partial [Actinomycetota bacterium]|nr:hypothetical protein [Actinomycetota bacterium]